MNSLEIISAKQNITGYLNELNAPKELQRLIVKEIYEELREAALREALDEANKKEAEKG